MVILGIVEIIIGGLMTFFSGRCDPVEGFIRFFTYEGNDINILSKKSAKEILTDLNVIQSGSKEITVIKIIGIVFILIGIIAIICGILKQFNSSLNSNTMFDASKIMTATNIMSAVAMGIIVFTGPLFGIVIRSSNVQSYFDVNVFSLLFGSETPVPLDYVGFGHELSGSLGNGGNFFVGVMLVLFIISVIAVIVGQFVSSPMTSSILSAMPAVVSIIAFLGSLLLFTTRFGLLLTVYSAFAWWIVLAIYIFIFNIVRVNSD